MIELGADLLHGIMGNGVGANNPLKWRVVDTLDRSAREDTVRDQRND